MPFWVGNPMDPNHLKRSPQPHLLRKDAFKQALLADLTAARSSLAAAKDKAVEALGSKAGISAQHTVPWAT